MVWTAVMVPVAGVTHWTSNRSAVGPRFKSVKRSWYFCASQIRASKALRGRNIGLALGDVDSLGHPFAVNSASGAFDAVLAAQRIVLWCR
ncbi:MAG: hypothetical protein ABJC13_14665 [Acidobacteriota bacterium]